MGQFAQTNYDNAISRDNLLSMLYPRLQLAKQLLRDDGVIFCSIDDRNQAYIKCLFDEVFGEGNFVSDFIRKTKSTTNDAKTGINYQHEFLLCYAKNKESVNLLGGEKDLSKYTNPDNDPNGRWVIADPSAKSGDIKTGYFAVKNPYTGKEDYPPEGRFWLFSQNTMQKHIDEGRICFKKEHKDNERGFIYKRYLKDLKTNLRTFDSLKFIDNAFMNQAATKELLDLNLAEVFTYPKGVEFIKEILRHSTNANNEESSLRGREDEAIHKKGVDCHEKSSDFYRNDKEDSNAKTIANLQERNFETQGAKYFKNKFSVKAEVSLRDFAGCQGGGEGSLVSLNDRADNADSRKSTKETTPKEQDIILDFFAGSGTTAHAVLELNREDGGNRKCILVTNNEITALSPNGIALDVTSKRLKRIMSGECYDGDKNFRWLEKNKPYGDNLEVCEIESCSAFDEGIFEKIDERLYGLEKFTNPNEKIKWVCENFERVMKKLVMNDNEGKELDEEDYEKALRKKS